MTRKMFVSAALVAACCFISVRAASGPDFSGTWILDPAKSEGLPPGMKQTMTVKQSGDTINLETNVESDEGTITVPDTYVLSGKETDFTPRLPGGGPAKGKRVAKWSAENKGLETKEVVTLDTDEGSVDVNITRDWKLSDDGKSLVIVITTETPGGTQVIKRTFNKKA